MVFIDRSLLTFDLVTRLSQVIKSANVSDINASNKIIDRLLDSCRFLGDCRLSTTLEQSTITLLLDLAATNESIKLKILPTLIQMLNTMDADSQHWFDKFETDFGKTFLLQLLKCDQNKACLMILEQLDLLLVRATSSENVPRELVIINGIFEVIGTVPQSCWGEHAKSVVSCAQRAIR